MWASEASNPNYENKEYKNESNSDCRLGLLKSTKTNSGSANKIILSVQRNNDNNYVWFAFLIIHSDWFCFQFCVGYLSRRDQILDNDGLEHWQKKLLEVTGINSIPRCCFVHYYRKTLKVWIVWKIKSLIFKVKLKWFLRQNNIPDVPTSFGQEFQNLTKSNCN